MEQKRLAEEKRVAAEQAKAKAEQDQREREADAKRSVEDRRRAAEDARRRADDEKRAREEEKTRLAEEKRRAAEDQKARKEGRKVEERRPVEKATEKPAVAAAPAALPPMNKDRFVAGFVDEEARGLAYKITDEVKFTPIPKNACPSEGEKFVLTKLMDRFDGIPAGTTIVLQLQDMSLGPTVQGDNYAFSGLRRMGIAADGAFVYCGRGSAFKLKAH